MNIKQDISNIYYTSKTREDWIEDVCEYVRQVQMKAKVDTLRWYTFAYFRKLKKKGWQGAIAQVEGSGKG